MEMTTPMIGYFQCHSTLWQVLPTIFRFGILQVAANRGILKRNTEQGKLRGK